MGWNKRATSVVAQKGGGAIGFKGVALAAGCLVLVLGGVAWWSLSGVSAAKTKVVQAGPTAGKLQHKSARAKLSPQEAVRQAMPANLPKKARKPRVSMKNVEIFGHLTGKDRKLAESVQAALDADDLTGTLKAATAALVSTNAEVRLNAVEALGWFGAEALPELTGCMADADEDVRNAAENCWELALDGIEQSEDKLKLALAAFGTLSNPDQLTSIAGIINGAASEWIDAEDDEKIVSERRLSVVQALVDVIDSGVEVNISAAKELYNDVTGNEWRSIDEAERYLADPDNYDPDEAPDEH